jgi:membrane-associated phospholipid phosphatase
VNVAAMAVGATGAAVLAASIAGARHHEIPRREQQVFHAVNGLPDWLYWLLWAPMQLGNLVVGTGAGLVAAAAYRSWAMAASVLIAMVLKLVAERVVRSRLSSLAAVRQRPGTSQVDAVLRGGDVPSSGASFPSGHVILVTGIACAVASRLPGPTVSVPFLLVLLVMVGRVYVGAHNPLDVTAGLGLGLLVGGLLLLIAD